jgi:phosphoserine phosphatase
VTHILCLIANPADPVLDQAAIAAVREALSVAAEPAWLAHGIAAELALGGGAAVAGIEGEARAALGNLPVDIGVVPAARRAKRILIADMDSTIIGQECIDELADFVGLRAEISAITERAMLGELAFEESLRQRVALLRGLAATAIDEVLAERIAVTPGARMLIETMRAHGAHTALVSGGFTAFTGPVARAVGFDEAFANALVLDGDYLAGSVEEPVRGREAKLQALVEFAGRHRVPLADTMAVGDGANDLGMIGAAGLGVAYRAKPAVAAAANVRIEHSDLTALLYLQGYRAESFAA